MRAAGGAQHRRRAASRSAISCTPGRGDRAGHGDQRRARVVVGSRAARNQSGPWRSISARWASVSGFWTSVGRRRRPRSDGQRRDHGRLERAAVQVTDQRALLAREVGGRHAGDARPAGRPRSAIAPAQRAAGGRGVVAARRSRRRARRPRPRRRARRRAPGAGASSSSTRSLELIGSPSAALTSTRARARGAARPLRSLTAVGNDAPPRPRRPDALDGVDQVRARRAPAARGPPRARPARAGGSRATPASRRGRLMRAAPTGVAAHLPPTVSPPSERSTVSRTARPSASRRARAAACRCRNWIAPAVAAGSRGGPRVTALRSMLQPAAGERLAAEPDAQHAARAAVQPHAQVDHGGAVGARARADAPASVRARTARPKRVRRGRGRCPSPRDGRAGAGERAPARRPAFRRGAPSRAPAGPAPSQTASASAAQRPSAAPRRSAAAAASVAAASRGRRARPAPRRRSRA